MKGEPNMRHVVQYLIDEPTGWGRFGYLKHLASLFWSSLNSSFKILLLCYQHE